MRAICLAEIVGHPQETGGQTGKGAMCFHPTATVWWLQQRLVQSGNEHNSHMPHLLGKTKQGIIPRVSVWLTMRLERNFRNFTRIHMCNSGYPSSPLLHEDTNKKSIIAASFWNKYSHGFAALATGHPSRASPLLRYRKPDEALKTPRGRVQHYVCLGPFKWRPQSCQV